MWIAWDLFLMKKLLKSEICGFINSARCALISWKKSKKSQILRLLFMHCSMNSNRKFWLFKLFFNQSVHIVYCSQIHKFHFSATFSLKMGPTILFTHLKIILLQYFSVFSLSFQFSAISKRTLHPSSAHPE